MESALIFSPLVGFTPLPAQGFPFIASSQNSLAPFLLPPIEFAKSPLSPQRLSTESESESESASERAQLAEYALALLQLTSPSTVPANISSTPATLNRPNTRYSSAVSRPHRQQRPVKRGGKSKRVRHNISSEQLTVLEKIFLTEQFPNFDLRAQLADQLGMTPRRVQIWFQNRRAKVKKDNEDGSTEGSNTSFSSPKDMVEDYSAEDAEGRAEGSDDDEFVPFA